jgi:hypothetical protein
LRDTLILIIAGVIAKRVDPLRHLPISGSRHPLAQQMNQLAFLGDRNEFGRVDNTFCGRRDTLGMDPATATR